MIEKNNFDEVQSVAAEHSNTQPARRAPVGGYSRPRNWWRLGAATLVAALAVGVLGRGDARGQVTPLQIIPLAQGTSYDNNVILHLKGPSDVLHAQLIFQPGADTGWDTHPGPVVVVIKSGALSEIHSDGCTSVHPAGSVFFEQKDEVHNALNQTSGVTEVYAVFLSPEGAQPLIPASDPGAVCRN
jgi:quercetin dioxygenase-like cupin family protein